MSYRRRGVQPDHVEKQVQLGKEVWLDLDGQMTLVFPHKLSGRLARANLVKYPEVQLTDAVAGRQEANGAPMSITEMVDLSSSLSRIVRQTLLGIAGELPEALLRAADLTGAGVLHCLLLSNHDEALKLSLELIQTLPMLLHVTHVNNGGALCFFEGEGPLHIAAVNHREDFILRALDVAYSHDPRAVFGPSQDSQARVGLLQQTCEGPFFTTPPMSHLGGTALAYCAAFNLSKVLQWAATKCADDVQRRWLFHEMRPVFGGKERRTGYSVLHAVVANGAMQAYDALMNPPCRLQGDADSTKRLLVTSRRLAAGPTLAGVSALRFAAKLGKSHMVEHILSHEKQLMWKWGPVAQYKISLDEIDTGPNDTGRQQVLDFAADVTASFESQRLLTDDVLNGFLFDLIRDK